MHARYTDQDSDFMSWLQLWGHIKAERNERSGNGFRTMCRNEYLHFLRIREWEDVHRQLCDIATGLGLRFNQEPAAPDAIHQALLSGLLAQVGFYDSEKRVYRGTRNARFVLAGGSALKKRTPTWIMAAELVETNQLRPHGGSDQPAVAGAERAAPPALGALRSLVERGSRRGDV